MAGWGALPKASGTRKWRLVAIACLLPLIAVQAAEVSLSWTDNSDNEAGFRVERRTGRESAFVPLGSTSADVTSFTDSSLIPRQEYWYRVCAYNRLGDSEFAYSAAVLIEPKPPTLSKFEGVSLEMNQSKAALAFVVTDPDTDPAALRVLVSSSDPVLLPADSIFLAGMGNDRSLAVVPAVGKTGSAIVTVTVSDGFFSVSESFPVEVIPPIPVPVIGLLANVTLGLNLSSGPIGFSVSDERVNANDLIVTATSSNPELLPDSRITLNGQGSSRWFALSPLPNISGQSTVTLVVSNGARTSRRSFVLTVKDPAAPAPVIPVPSPTTSPVPIGPSSYFSRPAPAGAPSNRVALLIDADQGATLMAVGPDIPGGVVRMTFPLPPAGTHASQAGDAGVIAVSVAPTLATVHATANGLVMGGSPDGAAGTTSPRAGLYSSPLCFSSDGRIDVLAGQGGQALVAVRLDDVVASGLGDVQPDGMLALPLSNGGFVSLMLGDEGMLSGTTTMGGKVYPVRGGRSGVGSPSSLVNLSVRSKVMPGAGSMVVGFAVSGSGSKGLLIRAIGPTLSLYGVPDALRDPRIEVRRTGVPAAEAVVGSNDNGPTVSVPPGSTAQGAFPLPLNSVDASLLLPISAGAYTVGTTDAAAGSGVALVELYDADDPAQTSTAKLANLSVRTRIGTGDEVAIVGFMIAGDLPKRLLVRGVGPELVLYGLSGVLPDPQVSLFQATSDGSRLITEVDDISGMNSEVAAAAAKVGAFPLVEPSKSAALAVWLTPGVYTVTVRGGPGGAGIGLVEVYDIP